MRRLSDLSSRGRGSYDRRAGSLAAARGAIRFQPAKAWMGQSLKSVRHGLDAAKRAGWIRYMYGYSVSKLHDFDNRRKQDFLLLLPSPPSTSVLLRKDHLSDLL